MSEQAHGSHGSAHGSAPSIDYSGYLRLPELLELQTLQSTPEHPDELLFIVVHQASELWFKVLRHEMDTMITALEAFDTMRALLAVQRINVLTEIIAQQLTALKTKREDTHGGILHALDQRGVLP